MTGEATRIQDRFDVAGEINARLHRRRQAPRVNARYFPQRGNAGENQNKKDQFEIAPSSHLRLGSYSFSSWRLLQAAQAARSSWQATHAYSETESSVELDDASASGRCEETKTAGPDVGIDRGKTGVVEGIEKIPANL